MLGRTVALWCAVLATCAYASAYTVDCNRELTDCDQHLKNFTSEESRKASTTISITELTTVTDNPELIPKTNVEHNSESIDFDHIIDGSGDHNSDPKDSFMNYKIENFFPSSSKIQKHHGLGRQNKKLSPDLSDVNLDNEEEEEVPIMGHKQSSTAKDKIMDPLKFLSSLSQSPLRPIHHSMDSEDNDRVCMDKGKTYMYGETLERECEESCLCMTDGRFECTPRCKKPFIRRGSLGHNDPLCFETHVDDCCSIVACANHDSKTPNKTEDSANSICRFNNTMYESGSTWHVGCEQTCTCENGYAMCRPRCEEVKPSDKCINVPDPADTCCEMQVCDVTHDAHEDNTTVASTDNTSTLPTTTRVTEKPKEHKPHAHVPSRPLVLTEPIGSVKVLQNNSVQVTLMHMNSSEDPIHLLLSDDGGKTFKDIKLAYSNMILNLQGGKDYILKTEETDTKFNFTITAADHNAAIGIMAEEKNVTEEVGCYEDGKFYKVGEEFHIGCTSLCECLAGGERECAALACPAHVGLELVWRACVAWAPAAAPAPPHCCPRPQRCLSTGACTYNEVQIPNWSEVPISLTGCEKRCFCENGELECQEVCSPLPAIPPQTLRCPPNHRVAPVNISDEDCCQEWGCLLTPLKASEKHQKAIEAYTSHSPNHLNISIALPHEFRSNISTVGIHITPEISDIGSGQHQTNVSSPLKIFVKPLLSHYESGQPHINESNHSQIFVKPLLSHYESEKPQINDSTHRKIFVKPVFSHYEADYQSTTATTYLTPDKPTLISKPDFRAKSSFSRLPPFNITNFILKNKPNLMQLHDFYYPHVIKFSESSEYFKPNSTKNVDFFNLYSIKDKEIPMERILFGNNAGTKHHKTKMFYPPMKNPPSQSARPFFKHKSSLLNQTKSIGNKLKQQAQMLFYPVKFPNTPKNKFHLPLRLFQPARPLQKLKIHKTMHSLTAGFHKNTELESKIESIGESFQNTPNRSKSKISPAKSIKTLDHKKYANELAKIFQEIERDYGDVGHNLERSASVRYTNTSEAGATTTPTPVKNPVLPFLPTVPPKSPPETSHEIHYPHDDLADYDQNNVHKPIIPHPIGNLPNIPGLSGLPPVPSGYGEVNKKLTVISLQADSPSSVKMLFGLPPVLVGLRGSVDLRYTDKDDEEISHWYSQVFAPADEVLTTSRLEFRLSGLKPSTLYKVRAKLYLHNLPVEPESEVYTVRTQDLPVVEEKRREIDSLLSVVEVNDTTAHVTWRHFTEDELRFIDGIQIRYRPIGTPIYLMTELLHNRRTNTELRELRPETQYEASIVLPAPPQARTELYDSNTRQFTTAQHVDPYGWSVRAELITVGALGVQVSWRGVPEPAERWVRVFRAAHACDSERERDRDRDREREKDAFRLATREQPAHITLTHLPPHSKCRVWLELFLTNGKVKTSNVLEINTKSLDEPETIDNVIEASSIAGSRGASRGDYYGALVAVGVIAALGAVTSLLLLLIVVRRHRPRTHNITPIPSAPRESSLPPYDNPAYKIELQQETMDL